MSETCATVPYPDKRFYLVRFDGILLYYTTVELEKKQEFEAAQAIPRYELNQSRAYISIITYDKALAPTATAPT